GLAGELSRPLLGSLLALCFAGEILARIASHLGGKRNKQVGRTPLAPYDGGEQRGSKSEIPAGPPAAPYEAGEQRAPHSRLRNPHSPLASPLSRGHWVVLATLIPFLLAMLLASILPSTDFDVNEYHFQGPKEYFQAGCVKFLEHNVYTSFPFATEMLTLLSMVLRDDWYRGALAGKGGLVFFWPFARLAPVAAGPPL